MGLFATDTMRNAGHDSSLYKQSAIVSVNIFNWLPQNAFYSRIATKNLNHSDCFRIRWKIQIYIVYCALLGKYFLSI